ncbi:MAG: glucose-6-phosphate isomerase family protein [Candidatus Taylorbacteria bacterium]|nr:glucose-6-phosphate isomerase family protein [Candidatus Taylorbacteria bacterium]
MIQPFATRTHEKMKEVLMNPEAMGPDIHYYMIRGGSIKKNITIWESGTSGDEYIKAYGHYHKDDLEETYTILAGEGMILLQSPIIDSSVESFKVIKVKEGDTVRIPGSMGHLALNTGNTWFVTKDDSPTSLDHADYEPIRNMKGFAYYVIRKDDKPAFIKNPFYKTVPEIDIS